MSGPLTGLKVVELLGQGPGPYCGMLLADLGCDVVEVVRPTAVAPPSDRPATNPMARGKRSVAIDMKAADGPAQLLALLDQADVFIDPFRPGVCERLGIGPEVACARNPRLIYGRMTGWGQDGPWAQAAGHDIDYIALSGALHAIGYEGQPPTRADQPARRLRRRRPAADDGRRRSCVRTVRQRTRSGDRRGDGRRRGDDLRPVLRRQRRRLGAAGTNQLDGGAHFYNVYETSDGKWLAVGAIEPQFYSAFLDGLGVDDDGSQWAKDGWPAWKERVAAIIRTRTRAEWEQRFDGTDACVAPVLEPAEVETHPHTAGREVVLRRNGVPQPNTAPRFSRTPGSIGDPTHPGADSLDALLAAWS